MVINPAFFLASEFLGDRDEQVFWKAEAKLRNVHENIDHRFDFARMQFQNLGNQTNMSFLALLSSLDQRHK